MNKLLASLATFGMLFGAFAPTTAMAQNRDDQRSARQEMAAGNVMSLRQISRIVVPRIERQERGYRLIASEWDEVARAYRLKFSRDGHVIWVDVDARNARILRIQR